MPSIPSIFVCDSGGHAFNASRQDLSPECDVPSRLQCGDIAAQIALRVMRPRHVLATPKNQMHEVDAAKVASYRPVTNGPTCRLSPTRGALGRCGRRTRLVSSLGATDAYR